MADKYASITTYNYAFNNPVVLNDPMGDDAADPRRDPWNSNRYYADGTPKVMQDAHAGGGVQGQNMFGSGFASTKGLSSFINYALNHSTNGGTWSANGSYSFFSSNTDAYSSAVASEGPMIYNTFCSCMVNAFDVLAINPAVQNKGLRAWAQTAVNIYNTRAQLYNGIAEAHNRIRENEKFFDWTGKADVVANSFLGANSEGWQITSRQIRTSRYWTASTKESVKLIAKGFRSAGYLGIGISTGLSGYELFTNGGKNSDWARFATGLAITGIAFIPYVGLPTSIVLGSIEAAGGFDTFYESFDRPRPEINGFNNNTMHDSRYSINKY